MPTTRLTPGFAYSRARSRHWRSVAAILALTVAGGTACKRDNPTGPQNDQRTVYALCTANGRSLPATFLGRDVRSASVTLFEDRRHALTIDGVVAEAGVWEQQGTKLLFASEEQILFEGTLENGTLTIQVQGPTILVFKK